MSRLLYQAELHRREDRASRSSDRDQPILVSCQSPFTESNRRPSPYHGDALPTELKGHSGIRPRLYLTPEGLPAGVLGQVRTNSRRCTEPGAAERTPVRASSQLSRRSSGNGRLTRKPCSLSQPISASRLRVSSSSTPSATTRSPRLCASSMMERAMNDSPWLVAIPSTKDLSIFTSSMGSWRSWDSEE